MSKNRLVAASITVAALLATGGTALAASSFKTVSQKTAEAAPPPASELTSPVEKRQLFDTINLTCKAGFRSQEEVLGTGKTPQVLTSSPLAEGNAVGDVTLLGEINGTPLFTLVGPFPLYRDLKLKDVGRDVRMVNDALVRAGLLFSLSEPTASTVTPYTVEAVKSLYAQNGYTAPKSDEVVVSAGSFHVLSKAGSVTGAAHTPGPLQTEPIVTVGIGARGLVCASANGLLPAEARDGQKARVNAVGPDLFPIQIITAAPQQTKVPAEGTAANKVPAQGDTSTLPSSTQSIFIEIGEAATKLSGTVDASLILAESNPEQLVVPSSALWTKEGQTLVTVQTESGTRDFRVEVTFSALGENTITIPDPESALAVGANVVISGSR